MISIEHLYPDIEGSVDAAIRFLIGLSHDETIDNLKITIAKYKKHNQKRYRVVLSKVLVKDKVKGSK